MDVGELRRLLLEEVERYSKLEPHQMQSQSILGSVQRRLPGNLELHAEQALLTLWDDLFRQGLLSWGFNLQNPSPPFCHLTVRGRETMARWGRDPINPEGYMAHLRETARLPDISAIYMQESLRTYGIECYRATAVMVGVATEALVLGLRDAIVNRLVALGRAPVAALRDWKFKTVRDALTELFTDSAGSMPQTLRHSFTAYWPAMTEQIRVLRNDAGHPGALDTVTPESAHASMLVFPEFARLTTNLEDWIAASTL